MKPLLHIVLDNLTERQVRDIIKDMRREEYDEYVEVLVDYLNKTYTDKIPALLRARFA